MKKLVLSIFIFCISIGLQAQKKWTLQECVDYAVKNNLQIIQNEISKKNQDINLKISKREYLPSVSANVGNSVSFGQASLGTGSIRNDRFSNNANLGADILVFNNGRLDKQVRKVA